VTLSNNRALRRAVLVLGALIACVATTPAAAGAAVRLVAPAGADSGDCSVLPCASLGYAYGRAGAGDVIAVAPGRYGPQQVPDGTKAVTFQAAPGSSLAALYSDASNVVFDGFDIDGNFAKDLGFHNSGAANATFRNGRIGNITDEKGALITGPNFTFDNVVFHDVIVTDGSVHNECIYALDVNGLTIRNSHFYNCATMDVFFTYGTWWNPKPPSYGNITLENNIFEHSTKAGGGWHYYSVYIGWTGDGGGPINGWTVRNNTFEIPATFDQAHESATDSRWVGNLGSWDCLSGVTFRNNVGKRCSASDKAVSPAASSGTTTAAFGWLNPAGHDFRLATGSPAIDAGDPADAPATDRRGFARVGPPDAGALEFGASGPPGPGTGPGTGAPGGGPGSRGGALRIRRARLRPSTICVVPRRGCPGVSRLRVGVSDRARVSVRLLKVRGKKKPKRVRSFRWMVSQRGAAKIRARGLARGKYRVRVLARTPGGLRAAPRTLVLRVR
jgi:hypothetical protein